MRHRCGATLLEILVAVGILAVLIGLLLPAVQKVREAADRLRDARARGQLALAVHTFAAQHDGRLPVAVHGENIGGGGWDTTPALRALLPYLDGGSAYIRRIGDGTEDPNTVFCPLYVSRFDPSESVSHLYGTVEYELPKYAYLSTEDYKGRTSYAFNAQALVATPHIDRTFADGTSNTVLLVTHYAKCRTYYYYYNYNSIFQSSGLVQTGGFRRPTFADGGSHTGRAMLRDVYPAPGPDGQARASRPGATFQILPRFEQCDDKLPQALSAAGLGVAMADGSVRTVRPGVSEAAFWGAVSPAGGEVGGLD